LSPDTLFLSKSGDPNDPEMEVSAGETEKPPPRIADYGSPLW
jgi:hypothetical protein